MKTSKRKISNNSMPYLIAEIGVNHEGSLSKAKELIDLAALGGADAAKFQTYKASKLASKDSPAYWDTSMEETTSQFELFKKYDGFEVEDYIELAEYCKSKSIDFMSTPFDIESVDFLDPLMEIFKIASADITNFPLIKKICSKNKPLILSTGASTIEEIINAVNLIKNHGIPDENIALLQCILNYPTDISNANLGMILDLKNKFPNHVIGYSDHTNSRTDMLPLITAYSLGAIIIEKHFTFDKTLAGNDHYHAMDVDDCKKFVNQASTIHKLLGSYHKTYLPSEEISRKNARRSIVAAKFIKKGEIIQEQDLTFKRPAFGICTSNWDSVIGRKASKDIQEDEILYPEFLLDL